MEAPQQTPKKDDMQLGMEDQSRVSGSRRTRSQVAPDWPVKDAIILVNEISAVEGDCLKALSSYQKWKIISENCNALDVVRPLNQCRRKWDLLLAEYKKIKQWESKKRDDSYWSLESERRNNFGLPENFDTELFKAIDDLVKAQENRSDTEPDTDPEAEVDVLDAITESGSKKQRRQVVPQKSREEEKEQMAVKLRENAELIHAILEGNLTENTDYRASDLKNLEAVQTDFTRRQGDKLITCLGDLSDTLDQLCDLVQESG